MLNFNRAINSENSLVVVIPASKVSALLGLDLNYPSIPDADKDEPKEFTPVSGKRYVYGLKGIQELFNVCHATAQKYKDGILKDAVSQSGRKIVVDVDKALELFNSRKRK